MKKIINVIDLDNTLIPFDSFRKLVYLQIIKCNIRVMIITIFRITRLISAANFKKKILDTLEINSSISKLYINFAGTIIKSLDDDVLSLIKTNSKENDTINILCSASPNGYVQIIADKLDWISVGSGYYGNQFINMYGENKIKFIKKKYPKDKYIYNFAISDSKSDLGLLKLFNTYMLLKK